MKRESLPITDNEASLLQALQDWNSPEFKALADIVYIEPGSSKAMLLHAVFGIGVNEIRDHVREQGYRELMDSYTEEELADERAYAMSQQARLTAEDGAE